MKLAADRDRGLGLVRDAVVLVVQPQAVPVHGRLQVTLVGDVDDHLRALLDLEGRAGDGAVVAQHPHRGVPEPLGYRADPQVEGVSVGQLKQLRPGGLGQPGGIGGKGLGRGRLARVSVLLHDQLPRGFVAGHVGCTAWVWPRRVHGVKADGDGRGE